GGDANHFLITLSNDPAWGMTMLQWATARAGINNNNPATWPAPSVALLGISQRFIMTESERPAAAKGGVEGSSQISRELVQRRWHVTCHDGALRGIALYRGEKCWLEVLDAEAEPRVAVLRSLTPKQLQVEEECHRLFQKHVGTNCDYDSSGKRTLGGLRPKQEWQKFYASPVAAAAARRSYDANPLLGWFEVP